VNRRRNHLWWLLCLVGLVGGLMILPRQAWSGVLPQETPPAPTLPPALWMTPVGGEPVPGVTGPDYFSLGVILFLVLLAGAVLVAIVVFVILRTRKRPRAAYTAPGVPAAPPGYALVVRSGPGVGARYPLSQGVVTLGSAVDCQVLINHPSIFPHHARLTWDGRQFTVQDLGTTTGTFVNDYHVTRSVLLRPGDVLGLGGVVELMLQ
jgi:hypothetical protein